MQTFQPGNTYTKPSFTLVILLSQNMSSARLQSAACVIFTLSVDISVCVAFFTKFVLLWVMT